MKYLSLCLPTNGICEWVFPVLDSIYEQNVDQDKFEVIVTDNGGNIRFNTLMVEYAKSKKNLVYKKNNAFLFENQIEALKLATGEYLKFMNHRAVLEPGALQWMIDLIQKNVKEKPIIYLSNGVFKKGTNQEYRNFDEFVRGLGEYASWTTGVGVWRSDFEKIPKNFEYNKISPHSDVMFLERHKEKYIIDDWKWSHEIDADHSKKGKYDLYKTFGCEEIMITLQLFVDGDISAKTLKHVIRAYEKCLANFYLEFNILKKPCSYILDSFNDVMGIFVSKKRILLRAYANLSIIILKWVYGKFLERCK